METDRDPLRKNAVWVSARLRKADADLLDERFPDGGHALEAGSADIPAREPDLDLGLPQLQLQNYLIVPWARDLSMGLGAAGRVLHNQRTLQKTGALMAVPD